MSKPPTPAAAQRRAIEAAGLDGHQADDGGARKDESPEDDRAAFIALDGPLTGAELLDQVRAVLVKYVIFPRGEDADAITLWIAATHAQPAWECAARLQIRSPLKRCGKSRLLDLVEALCFTPLLMVLASPAALFRSIDGEEPPTLLLDESDTIFGTKEKSESQEAIRGILNAGHQRGRTIPRCVPPMQEVKHFPTFAMAGLAGIGSLPDTIEDRSVVIELHRKAPGETVAKLRWRRVRPGLHQLRDQLHTWARANLDGLREADPELPVDDRAADTWEPLAAIADMAGGEWPERARKACRVLTGTAGTERETNLGVAVLGDLRDIFAANAPADKAHTDALLGDLHKIDEAPWANYYGHPLDSRDLAKLLKPYGIKSRDVWIEAVNRKGYRVSDLWDTWARYLPDHAEGGRRVTEPGRQGVLGDDDPPVAGPGSLYPDARSARSARTDSDQPIPPSPNAAYPLGPLGQVVTPSGPSAHAQQGLGADQQPSPPSPPSDTPWTDGTTDDGWPTEEPTGGDWPEDSAGAAVNPAARHQPRHQSRAQRHGKDGR